MKEILKAGNWRLRIKAYGFKTFYGYKDISKEIKWDGKSDKGKVIDPRLYCFFSATDSRGLNSIPTKTISVKTFKPKLSVFVSPQIFLLHPGRAKIIMKMNLDKNDIRTKHLIF